MIDILIFRFNKRLTRKWNRGCESCEEQRGGVAATPRCRHFSAHFILIAISFWLKKRKWKGKGKRDKPSLEDSLYLYLSIYLSIFCLAAANGGGKTGQKEKQRGRNKTGRHIRPINLKFIALKRNGKKSEVYKATRNDLEVKVTVFNLYNRNAGMIFLRGIGRTTFFSRILYQKEKEKTLSKTKDPWIRSSEL